ncbi:hypothetical protein Tco_1569878 [Tanacetum coccineum]
MNYIPQLMQDPKDSSDPTTAMNMEIALLAKAFKVNAIPTNNNQRSSLIPCNSQIAQSGMNMSQDIKMQMVDDNVGNQVRQNAVQNLSIHIVENMNGHSVVSEIANQYGNGNVVTTPVEGNVNGINGNPIRLLKRKKQGSKTLKRNLISWLLQQASTSGTQSDKALIYDSDESAEVRLSKNYYDNDIFNMFTQEDQGTVEQHPATVEETRVYQESLFHNLVAEVEKVNSVNRKMKETNAELTIELARYKNQEKCFEISQEKYDKHERCYQQSVYQEQYLTKRINALHLSSGKQITALNEEISNLNKQLSKEKSTVSSLQEEKKRLKSNFKIHEDELLDKQIQLENKIKELDNILVKTGQSIQTMHMLSPKPDSFYHSEHKMALGYQNPFYLKKAQQKQHSLYNGKILLEKHDPPVVYDSEETLELAQEKATKFVRDFKSLVKEADESLVKHKALELEIESLLRAIVSRDIMSVVQNNSVVDTSNLQTELERTKESFENCIIKKENECAKLWNDWYKKCKECKYDKISYDKAYNDMQQKIERLQAQLGDLKGKSNDTPCVSNTLDPLPHIVL